MAWRDKQREDDRLRHRLSAVAGVVLGALLGAMIGLGICMYVLPFTILFPGDTIVAWALICWIAGLIYGEPFIDWLLENFWNLT